MAWIINVVLALLSYRAPALKRLALASMKRFAVGEYVCERFAHRGTLFTSC